MLCEYGCGQEATHKFKNSKWCCSKRVIKCPSIGNKISKKLKNISKSNIHKERIKNSKIGTKQTLITRKKISKALKGDKNPFYNKHHTTSTKQQISESLTGQNNYYYNKKRPNHSLRMLGKNNPAWKGGYSLKNIPLFKDFIDRLTIEELPERDIKDNKVLTVLCTYCKKRFIPKLNSVNERVRALNGGVHGESRLYCSEECKLDCSIFNQKNNSVLKKLIISWYNSKEYQEWRTIVLEQDNYICQWCDAEATVAHHILPQKTHPEFALDPENGLSCCKKCHYKYGHRDRWCTTGYLGKLVCERIFYMKNKI